MVTAGGWRRGGGVPKERRWGGGSRGGKGKGVAGEGQRGGESQGCPHWAVKRDVYQGVRVWPDVACRCTGGGRGSPGVRPPPLKARRANFWIG